MKTKNKLFLIGLLIIVAIGFFAWLSSEDKQTSDIDKKVVAIFNKDVKIASVEVDPVDSNLILEIFVNDVTNIEKLKEAIVEIEKRPALKVMAENERIIDGVKALVMEEIAIPKNDPSYFSAVEEVLSSEFGFETSVEKVSFEKIKIDQGTVATFEDIRIGVVSVSKSEYVDDEGTKKEGIIALLQIHYSEDSSKDENVTAFVGKTFVAGDYRFTVGSVDSNINFTMKTGSPSGSVTLLF